MDRSLLLSPTRSQASIEFPDPHRKCNRRRSCIAVPLIRHSRSTQPLLSSQRTLQHGLFQVCRYFGPRSKLGRLGCSRRVEHRIPFAGNLLGWVRQAVKVAEQFADLLLVASQKLEQHSSMARYRPQAVHRLVCRKRRRLQIKTLISNACSLSNPDVTLLTSKLALTAVSTYSRIHDVTTIMR